MSLKHEISLMHHLSRPGKPAVDVVPLSVVPAVPPCCPCGSPVDADLLEIRNLFPSLSPDMCTACYEAARREDEERDRRDRENAEHRRRLAVLESLAEVAGAKVFATDISHRTFNAALWVAAAGWTPESGRWLVIHGPPGSCKTRVVGLLAKRMVLDGRRVTWTTAGKFQEAVEALNTFGKGDSRLRAGTLEDLERWKKAEVLVLDDIGKNTWFPTLEAKLFELIDHRETHWLPTILTSNRPPTHLIDDMSADRGGPIIGRILDAARGWVIEAKPIR